MNKIVFGVLILGGLIATVIYSFGPNKTNAGDGGHRKKVEQWRKAKEDLFRNQDESPITAAQRTYFKGLNYYPIEKQYHIIADFTEHHEKEILEMNISDGSTRNYVLFGKARFVLHDQKQELSIFKPAENAGEDYLFLPFYDLTTAEETYGSGRYLEPVLIDDAHMEIDFNLAYNPYCAYNPKYRCPIPPKENKITVSVHAGEKIPDFTH